MSAFSRSGLPVYQGGPDPATSAKPPSVRSVMADNGHFCLNSADRITGTAIQPNNQPYNNFIISPGYPILQGNFGSVRLAEVRFPWCIPNVNTYNNILLVLVNGVSYPVPVNIGFYNGESLATELNNSITGAGGYPGAAIPAGQQPTVAYDNNGSFTITPQAGDTVAVGPNIDPANLQNYPANLKCLAQLMGFANQQWFVPGAVGAAISGGFAPMLYTDYVDICSDVMTQYQDQGDVSTFPASKRHIICRLYIADEISLTSETNTGAPIIPGEAPFMIHRQFKNPKIMRWNGQNSIDRIDIQLFDDAGNPLFTPVRGVPNFQITFLASE